MKILRSRWTMALLVVLVLEAVFRISYFFKIPQEYRPTGAEALKQIVLAGSYVAEFPGGTYLFDKPRNVYRIVALGGSTTIGHDNVQNSWPYQLSKQLNERSSGAIRYEVINLGWWGAWSAHELYYLLRYEYLKPDCVILYDGYNDVLYGNMTPRNYGVVNQKIYELIQKPSWPQQAYHKILRGSALANKIRILLYRFNNRLNQIALQNRWFGVGTRKPLPFAERADWYRTHEAFWEKSEIGETAQENETISEALMQERDLGATIYQKNLEAIATYLQTNGIRGLYVFQPYLAEKSVRLKRMEFFEEGGWAKNMSLQSNEFLGRQGASRKEVMEAVAKRYGLHFLDARMVFDSESDSEVYCDTCHYTPRGTAMIAGIIASSLKEILL